MGSETVNELVTLRRMPVAYSKLDADGVPGASVVVLRDPS
jgi:hypothetical protein